MDNMLYQVLEWFYLLGIELLVIVIALITVILIKQHYQNKFRKFIQDSPLAVMAIDESSGELLLSNRPAMQLLGVRLVGKKYCLPLTMTGSQLKEVFFLVNGSSFKSYLSTWTISEHHSFTVEFTGRKMRYGTRWVWLLYAVKHLEAEPESDEVRTSLKITRTALDSLSELIYIRDNNGNIIDSNRSFDAFWRDREEESDILMQGVMQGRKSQRRWTTDTAGRSCLLETSQTPLVSNDGDVLGALGISHDVTDWFKMQQDLREEMDRRKGTEMALAQREIILTSILESSPDVIALFNEERVYQACNQAYVDSMDIDMKPEQLIGKKIEDILPAHLKQRFIETDAKVLEQGETLRYIDEIMDKSGKPKWYDVVKSPYRDPSTGITGVLLLARDVTERYLTEQKLEEANQELARLSFVDGLTQVANRRRFDEQLDFVWNLHRREQNPLTVILCDIDFFKEFNDNYGHLKGDQALVDVANAFKATLTRTSDCVARYGGEEFAFILPNTNHNGAQIIASNIHLAVKKLAIAHEFSQVSDFVTVSIGVASFTPQKQESPELMLSHADDALYAAKKQGRNQTQYYYQ
ncbi:diguanylate cyclase domain-containing protein [Vibrio sp. SCSIO 43137]|uniref:diguanylate cyclase domain-containing protein n=1 Tax=Vibrio sp. SCSIO 43137 TaxID=3021011 RepID=UPI002307852B|nr:diguanylate cyclase [Vibrio sp. SCSIO 43137]WCE30199.1 diguanylate cyclase [Vibrio sp. SCSIO 43137]